MGAMPSRAKSESYKGLLPIELSIETPAVFTADMGRQQFANEQPSDRQEDSRPFARFLITFCIGVAATLTWQSYNGAVKKIIAGSSPQFAWLAPQAPVGRTVTDAIEQIITRIADRIVANIAAGQEQISHSRPAGSRPGADDARDDQTRSNVTVRLVQKPRASAAADSCCDTQARDTSGALTA